MGRSLVSNIQHTHRGYSAHQKDHVKPPMIKVEVDVTQNLSDNDSIVWGQVHSHEQDTWHKVHSHYLRQKQHQEITGLGAGDCVEPFDEVDEEAPDRADNDDADDDEAEMLGPELSVKLKTEPVCRYFQTSRYGVFLSNSVEDNVNCTHEYLVRQITWDFVF